MSKKKIDELFQEKLLGFKEVPDDRVWASIEASLDQRKKKRIVPLWWSLGGIAAALLVGLLLFNPLDTETNIEQIITDVEQPSSDTLTNPNNAPETLDLDQIDEHTIVAKETEDEVPPASENSEIQVVTTEKTEGRPSKNANKTNRKVTPITGNDRFKQNEAIVTTKQQNKGEDRKYEDINQNNLKTDSDVAKNEKTKNPSSKGINTPTLNEKAIKDKEETMVASNDVTKKEGENTENVIVNPIVKMEMGSENKETQVVQNTTEQKADNISDTNKKSIFDEITRQEKEKEAVAETSTKKWSAGPSVAPVYFNAMGEGSSVHSIFVPNAKSGNVNMSYGLSVGYELSSKLKVRTGIHKVDFGYDTNDIAFSSSPIATTNGQIDNINYRTTSRNLVVSSKPGGSAREQAPQSSLDFSSSQNIERDGVMTQQMGYLEIPVELNYALIDKKFGLNVIGGVSSLFLVDNSVVLSSGNLTTEMGDANNLNNLNFSANFGLGVNYKFSRNIHLNIEPVFKYQLNTFSQTDGTFNPYALGVYSGLNFRF
ncbi:outer membrane beta-barrel protein [Maribacter chungangensis]|uniref:Outer membrane beta-barrel protein n=1 Tax=Maribacter chungangensis TaxID=1069117 RepID=A0ABW3AXW0_9FLAO